MGFKTEQDRLRRFEVKHFGISHTSDKPLPNHIEAQVFNPGKGVAETKYIEKYPGVEGRVMSIEWYQREDKNNGQIYRGYQMTMDIGSEVILLDIPFKRPPSKIYSLMVRHGENVDWSKPLEISAWKTKNKKDQDTTGVCLWQVDAEGKRTTVKSAHTIDNPNGCPSPDIDELTGEKNWAGVERWLKFNFDDKVIPAVKKAAEGYIPTASTASAANGSAEVIAEHDEFDDDGDAYPVPQFAGQPKDEIEAAQQHIVRQAMKPELRMEDSIPF